MGKLLTVMLCWLAISNGPVYPAPPTDKQLEQWWKDLAKKEGISYVALLKLSQHPEQTIPFLKKHLTRLELDDRKLKKLLADLGSGDEKIAKSADQELRRFDPRLAKDVEKYFDEKLDALTLVRLVTIFAGWEFGHLEKNEILPLVTFGGHLEHTDFVYIGIKWINNEMTISCGGKTESLNNILDQSEEWLLRFRAIAILEHFGSTDAIEILQELAKGNKVVRPTKEAVEALKRLRFSLKE